MIPEERIRLDSKPVSPDLFAKNYFEVHNKLRSAKPVPRVEHGPRYLQMWALTALHTFIKEKVDVAVIETHHGGEFDATNFLQQTVVTVVTTLGMDHVEQLGPTLRNIAWHKAGIFKTGAAAISAPQDPEGTDVLRARATEREVHLEFANVARYTKAVAGLPAEVLRVNCSVAIAAAKAFLCKTSSDARLSEEDIDRGIQGFSWPGRFQIIHADGVAWFLDSAHNIMSVTKAAKWFHEASTRNDLRVSPFVRSCLPLTDDQVSVI